MHGKSQFASADGYWCQPDPTNPAIPFYFTVSEGQALFDSLVQSRGAEAKISAYVLECGWLLNTWSGLIALSHHRLVARMVSCGCGDRQAVGCDIRRISKLFIALRRDQTNNAHSSLRLPLSDWL